jgi:dipeptidyl aminopeptidase/acylaminoacyl peptidase
VTAFSRRALGFSAAAVIAVLVAATIAIAWRTSSRVTRELHPPREAVGPPIGLPNVESIAFQSRDGVQIHGWYVAPRNKSLVILVHGYGGNRSQLLPEARALVRTGYGVLLFDLRGHGESGGDRTTLGVLEQLDLEGALDFASTRPEVHDERVGAVGFSIGAMLLAQVAARDTRVRAVVLEGGHTSLDGMIRHEENRWGPWSEWVAARTLLLEGVDASAVRPADVICRIAPRPVLIINGSADEDNPPDVARALYAAACEPKELWVIPGARHREYAATAGTALDTKLVQFFDAAFSKRGIVAPLPAKR